MTPPEDSRNEPTQDDHLSVEGSPRDDLGKPDQSSNRVNGESVSKDEMKALSGAGTPAADQFPQAEREVEAPQKTDLPPNERPATEEREQESRQAQLAAAGVDASATAKAADNLPPDRVEEALVEEDKVAGVEIRPLEPEIPAAEFPVTQRATGPEAVMRWLFERLPIPSRKLTVSVAAGLIAGIVVTGWLTTHRTRRAADLAELAEPKSPLEQAKSLMNENQYGAARDVLNRFLDETPESAERSEGLFLLAKTLDAIEQHQPTKTGYTEARETYRKAIDSNPSSPHVSDAFRAIARTYIAEQMYKEARDTLEEVVRKYPTLPDIAEVELEIAKTYLTQKDSSGAVQRFTDLIADYPASNVVPRARLSLGAALEMGRQYDKAGKLYQEVLTSFPGTEIGAEAQERLADLELTRGNYAAATDLYKKRVEMPVAVTGNDRVLFKLARTYAAEGKWKDCAKTCRTILDLFRKSDIEPETIILLCRAEQQNGHIEAAVQYALEGRRRLPENAALVKNLAELYTAKANYAEAAALYDKATELAPDDPQAWYGAGVAHLETGELDTSAKSFQQVITQFSSDALAYDAHLKLAEILSRQDKPQQAIDLLNSQLAEHVVSARRDPILSKIAEIYLGLDLPALAAETYGKMLDGVDDDEVLARMGMAYLKAKRWDVGLKTLERLDRTRLSGDIAYSMLVEMGEAFRGFGNLARATQSLEVAVNGYPTQRDERGLTSLLRTYLVADRVSDALKLVKQTETWAYGHPERKLALAQTKLNWGDYLFESEDHVNAAEQFSEIAAQEDLPTPVREWATYQKANCYLKLARYNESVAAYKQFLDTYPASAWKKAAQLRLDFATLEMKLKEQTL